jgi:hypothetical protein
LQRQRRLFEPTAEAVPERVTVDIRRVRVERTRDFGEVWLALVLWQKLGLDRLLSERLPAGQEEIEWSTAIALPVAGRVEDFRSHGSHILLCPLLGCRRPVARLAPRTTSRPVVLAGQFVVNAVDHWGFTQSGGTTIRPKVSATRNQWQRGRADQAGEYCQRPPGSMPHDGDGPVSQFNAQ